MSQKATALGLSKAQTEAIDHEYGNLQIIACAGSGKTEAITMKVASLVAKGHDPEGIVSFTFTEKAAEQLKVRIRKAAETIAPNSSSIGNMYIGTIHGFCLNLLREFEPMYENYEALDDRTRVTFLSNYGTFLHLKLDHLGVSGKYRTINEFCKNVDIIREEMKMLGDLPDSDFKESAMRYERHIDEMKVLDFTSMMTRAVKMLESDPQKLAKVRKKYRFVVVDEYQDINPVQERLIGLLCGNDGNLTVVGDDDQSIYQWRGTDVRNILTFAKRYSDVKSVKLEDNYRSSEYVIANANSIIRNNVDRLPKRMRKKSATVFAQPGDCHARAFATADDEAAWISSKIRELLGTEFTDTDGTRRPLTLGDFAILVRSVKHPASFIIPHLRDAGLDYVVKGRAGLFELDNIKLVMQCLAYLSDVSYRNDVPDLSDLEELYNMALPEKQHLAKVFLQKIAALKEAECAPTSQNPSILQKLFQSILDSIGLGAEEFRQFHMFQWGKFSNVIKDFEEHNQIKKIQNVKYFFGYVSGFATLTYERGGEDTDYLEDAITISSVHRVKGLEYPVVFMPYLLDDFFPSWNLERGGPNWLFDSDIIEDYTRYVTSLEDERRLFYVALTRSKKYLFLSHATQTHRKRAASPSRFLTELDGSTWINGNVTDPTERKKADYGVSVSQKIFPTSYSELRYYLACPHDYEMRYIYQFNPELATPLGYGKQLHNSLNLIHQQFKESGAMDVGTAKKIVDDSFFLRYAKGKLSDNYKKGALKTIENYVRRYSSEFSLVLESEKPFEFTIGSILISGKIDLIRKEGDVNPLSIGVLDFKTEEQKKGREVPIDTQTQLVLYAIASKESLGYNPKRAMVHNLDTNERKEVKLTEETMKKTKQKVSNVVEDIRKGIFPMKPDNGRACAECDWVNVCTKNIGGAAVA